MKQIVVGNRVVKGKKVIEGEDVEMEDENEEKETEGFDSEDESESENGDDEQVTVIVTRIAVSPDGQWLATADDRSRTHIFNLDSIQVS